jgi:NAD(P)-dependent dehydrogenase (short-subunit alcohol dehydrogenase family)
LPQGDRLREIQLGKNGGPGAGRPATADEIAEAIVFLTTDPGSFIYGANLPVDGGRTAI